ncbi:hypothetical protein ACFZAD_12160 [Streptomyces iakyrus]|uniref:hypothetical protein n=1 Tax=Streptomyces iakyrus TaxID=68219 RepID=UPI0036E9EA0A
MHDLIPRALSWLRLFFVPGTGKRRRGRPRLVSCPALPGPPRLPRHRSPYGLHVPLDGAASALVRPYLAADPGIDLDRHLIAERKVAA